MLVTFLKRRYQHWYFTSECLGQSELACFDNRKTSNYQMLILFYRRAHQQSASRCECKTHFLPIFLFSSLAPYEAHPLFRLTASCDVIWLHPPNSHFYYNKREPGASLWIHPKRSPLVSLAVRSGEDYREAPRWRAGNSPVRFRLCHFITLKSPWPANKAIITRSGNAFARTVKSFERRLGGDKNTKLCSNMKGTLTFLCQDGTLARQMAETDFTKHPTRRVC